jgi:hypothetical protein
VDDLWAISIGDCDGTQSQQRHADGATLEGQTENFYVAVVFDSARFLMKEPIGTLGVESSDEDLRIAGCRSIAAGGKAGSVDSKRGFVEVTFELKTGGLDELVVFGVGLRSDSFAEGCQAPNCLQIDVDVSVGFGQQAYGFGRAAVPKVEDDADGGYDEDNDKGDNKASGSFSHSASVISAASLVAREGDVG